MVSLWLVEKGQSGTRQSRSCSASALCTIDMSFLESVVVCSI